MFAGIFLTRSAISYFLMYKYYYTTCQTQDVESMLVLSWSTVYDTGPTLIQRWINVLCLMGRHWHWSLLNGKLQKPDLHIVIRHHIVQVLTYVIKRTVKVNRTMSHQSFECVYTQV